MLFLAMYTFIISIYSDSQYYSIAVCVFARALENKINESPCSSAAHGSSPNGSDPSRITRRPISQTQKSCPSSKIPTAIKSLFFPESY